MLYVLISYCDQLVVLLVAVVLSNPFQIAEFVPGVVVLQVVEFKQM